MLGLSHINISIFQVLDEVINYNNKPSNNSRDSRDALVAQFEKEMHRQGLNDKLDSLKLKVRNKMKNEVMSGKFRLQAISAVDILVHILLSANRY